MDVSSAKAFVASRASKDQTARLAPSRDPTIVSRDISDVDSMAAAIDGGIACEYVQLEARAFTGRWTVIHLSTLVLQFSREDVASVHRIRIPAGTWVFLIPLSLPAAIRWDGRAISEDEQIVCPPGGESFVFEPGGTEFALVSVTAESAPDLVQAARAVLGNSSSCRIFQPPVREARALSLELTEFRTTAESCPDIFARDYLEHANETIGRRLGRCLRGGIAGSEKRAASQSRSQIVRRAEQFFREHVGEAVSIAQLSTIAGVSERSLRNAFYHVYTTSPKKYLKVWQLHQVRRSLRAALDAPATVTNVATQHGFYELGRFAGEYRALFGEAPSQTLQRARSAVGERQRLAVVGR